MSNIADLLRAYRLFHDRDGTHCTVCAGAGMVRHVVGLEVTARKCTACDGSGRDLAVWIREADTVTKVEGKPVTTVNWRRRTKSDRLLAMDAMLPPAGAVVAGETYGNLPGDRPIGELDTGIDEVAP